MKRSAIIGAILLLLLSNFSCKDDPNSLGTNVAIDNEFKVLLWESLEGDFRSFHMNLQTIDSKFCENTLIQTGTTAENGNIIIQINEIVENSCDSAFFPAVSNFEIGVLDKKTHDLRINLQSIVFNYGKLKVTDDFYEIEMDNIRGITFPNTRLNRVPENTIWGYVAYDELTSEMVANSFIDELDNIANDKSYEDGYYGYFSSENNKLTILNQDIPHEFQETFGFEYDGTNSELLDVLSNFRSSNPAIEFKIFTSSGDVF